MMETARSPAPAHTLSLPVLVPCPTSFALLLGFWFAGRLAGKFRHAKNFADTAGTGNTNAGTTNGTTATVTSLSRTRTVKAGQGCLQDFEKMEWKGLCGHLRASKKLRLLLSSDKAHNGFPSAASIRSLETIRELQNRSV